MASPAAVMSSETISIISWVPMWIWRVSVSSSRSFISLNAVFFAIRSISAAICPNS